MRVQFRQPSVGDVVEFLVAWVYRLACLAVVIAFWIVLRNLLALYMAPWVSTVLCDGDPGPADGDVRRTRL